MGNFTDAVGDAIKGGVCSILRGTDAGLSWINELPVIDVPNAPRYWRPKLCDDNPMDIPPTPPPFEGGQCPGVDYVVDYQWDNCLTGVINSRTSDSVEGPITSIEAIDVGPGLGCGRTVDFVVVGANRTDVFRASRVTEGSEMILGVRRLDGLPDDCGNPPPDIPPYSPVTIPISPTYITNEGDEVTVEGDFILFAPVGVFAPVTTVFAPVRVDLGGVVFDGTLEIAPNFNFNFGTPPGDRSPGTGVPPTIPENPDTAPSTPDDESNDRLIGVYVRSQPSGNFRNTFLDFDGAPDLYVPRLASVFFRVRNRGTLGWLGPIDVKTTSAFVPVPANSYAIATVVHFEPGWTGSKADVRRQADFGA